MAYIYATFAAIKNIIMAKDLFNRYIWLVDTIYRADGITYEEINEKWLRSSLNEGDDLPLKTFHNHRKAIEETFDINIVCDKRNGYKYYIENAGDIEKGGVRTWLLNTFAVNNLINESHHLKHRIVFEEIPSGQKYLTPLIEAMRENRSVEITYGSFWTKESFTAEVEPWFVKVFRQRWYLIARNVRKDALRVYALDRITKLEQTENTFVMPSDFSPEEYFYNCFGVIRDEKIPPETVTLRVLKSKRDYIRSLPLHHSQVEVKTEEEYSDFTYYVSPTYDFISEILSHGYEVEVRSPSHLRGYIRWQAEAMASHNR